MKIYEQYSNLKVINDIPLLLRLDGRSFSKYTKIIGLEKPFDVRLRDIFIDVSVDLMNEFSPKYIYTFSDEINILFDEIPFNGRVEKIDSIMASYVSSSFMKHMYIRQDEFDMDILEIKPASFDSRVITTANHINEYFTWRQDEAWRNCLNSYAQFVLNKEHTPDKTAKLLYKLNKEELHELLFKHGINIAHVPTWQKRGVSIYKKKSQIKGFNPKSNEETTSYRNEIYVDTEIELFRNNNFKI